MTPERAAVEVDLACWLDAERARLPEQVRESFDSVAASFRAWLDTRSEEWWRSVAERDWRWRAEWVVGEARRSGAFQGGGAA